MSKKLNFKVSVICGVFNEGETFEKHLQSLADQSYKNKEMIIVDDGSIDKTAEIAKQFVKKYKFIKYFLLKHIDGFGCVRPRLEAIKHAKGEVLCMVDADAYYDKDYIKNGVDKLFSNNEIGAVVPRMHFWDPKTFISKYKSLLYEIKFNNLDIINKEIQEAKHSPWIVKREIYETVGGYNINDAYTEDVRLAKKILNKGYKMVHNGDSHWFHKLEEKPYDVIRKNFNIGRMYSTEKSFRFKTTLKFLYFLFPFLIVFFGIFYPILFLLLILHPIPMFFNSFKIFLKSRGLKNRSYAFYSPIVAYFVNFPNVFGIIYGFIKPFKKDL